MTDFTLLWNTDTGANGATLKLVLMAIGYCARIDGVCYARRSTLAKLTGLHQKTVDRACRELADKNLISMRERRSAGGQQFTSLIVLTISGHVRTDDSSLDLEPHDLVEFGEDGRQFLVQTESGTQIPSGGQSAGLDIGQSAGLVGAERGTSKGLSTGLRKDREEGAGAQDSDDASRIMSKWNNLAELYGFPIAKLLDHRRKAIAARRRDYGQSAWETAFEVIESSAFLRGEVKGRDGKDPFRLTFDWLAGPKNFAKVIDGNMRGGATPRRAGVLSDVASQLQAKMRADMGLQRRMAQTWKQDHGKWDVEAGPAPDKPGCILADSVLWGIGLAPGGMPLSHEQPAQGADEDFLE